MGAAQAKGTRAKMPDSEDASVSPGKRAVSSRQQAVASSAPGPAPKPLSTAALIEGMDEVARSVQQWDPTNFKMTRTLQEAVRNHGRVDLMTIVKEGKMVAVKRMPNKWVRVGPKEFDSAYATASEKPWADMAIVKILNRLECPFVCDHMGVFRDSEVTYVVTSLATEGDLFSWCDRPPAPGAQREELLRPIVVQLLSGVRWLHDYGIAHRDLSLENVLLTTEGEGDDAKMRVKIIDFGMVTLEKTAWKEVRGKPSYQAPEMHFDQEFDTFLTDSFALGVTIFAMSVQDYPWTSTKPNSCQMFEYVKQNGLLKFMQKRKLRKGGPGQLVDAISPNFSDFLQGLLAFQPAERFSLGGTTMSPAARSRSIWTCRWLEGKTPEDGWTGSC